MTRLALLSVSDKTGLVDFARTLATEFDFEFVSSGGTAKVLQEAGLTVTKVSDYTGFPEILGGRVKTLHPKVHGGILARRDVEGDREQLQANEIRPIDLVVVNLYPFEATIAREGVTLEEAIENIDIGGPTLLRAAAKNFAHLTVLCDPKTYDSYLEELRSGDVSLAFRRDRAKEVFWHTTLYDRAIATYLEIQSETAEFSRKFDISGSRIQSLRYGENPHQNAAWYGTGNIPTGWASAQQLQGKELSYNNLVDLEAARRIVSEFLGADAPPTAAVLKHTNPCGVAIGETLSEAYDCALAADSVSAFGGIVALNQAIDADTATALTKTFLECVVAPDCKPEAADILKKKSKVRVLVLPDLASGSRELVKPIAGGFLVQIADDIVEEPSRWQVATEKQPTPEQLQELLFAWKVAKHVKSNAIVLTKNCTTIGIGAGQMNRVGAAKIALEQAGEQTRGATLASDGFFPFDDTVRSAAAAGIEAIVQPGGSIRDKNSIAAANELGMVMVMTGVRHFLH